MSISLSISISLLPKKNTINVLTNEGIVFGGSAAVRVRLRVWQAGITNAPDGPAPRGVPVSGQLGPQVAELDQKQAHRRVRTAISSFGHPHCNLV